MWSPKASLSTVKRERARERERDTSKFDPLIEGPRVQCFGAGCPDLPKDRKEGICTLNQIWDPAKTWGIFEISEDRGGWGLGFEIWQVKGSVWGYEARNPDRTASES